MRLIIPLVIVVAIVSSLATIAGIIHWQPQLLGSFTQLTPTDVVNTFPTTYNANLNKTIEVGTTSVASITTLSNLAALGTITSGTWRGSAVATAYGGTGSTTLSQYQLLIGNGTNAIGIVSGLGSSGDFLKSQGAGLPPVWTTTSVDQAANYNWTGNHTFVQATTTYLYVSGHASTSQLTVGALGVGVSTTTQRNVQIAGDLQVSGACSGCGASLISRTASAGISGSTEASIVLTTIPANAMGVHGRLVVSGFVEIADTGDRHQVGIMFGGQNLGTSTFDGMSNLVLRGGLFRLEIANTTTGSQSYGFAMSAPTSTVLHGTLTVDTTSPQILSIYAKQNNGASVMNFYDIDVTTEK